MSNTTIHSAEVQLWAAFLRVPAVDVALQAARIHAPAFVHAGMHLDASAVASLFR